MRVSRQRLEANESFFQFRLGHQAEEIARKFGVEEAVVFFDAGTGCRQSEVDAAAV